MDTEVINDVEYPKGAWAQLEAALVCAGHSVDVVLKYGYHQHMTTCRVCGASYFVHRVRDLDGRGVFSAGIRPCPGQREDV